MAQPPPYPPPQQHQPTTFETRAFTPIRNPVYIHNADAGFKTAHPAGSNVLERPPVEHPDDRRTAQGSLPPVAGLTPIVPAAYQTPWNVWGLYPA